MRDVLLDYYFSSLEVLVLLFLVGGVGVAVYWAIWRRWRNRLRTLEQEVTEVRAESSGERLQALHDHLQSAVAHEFVHGLDYMASESAKTLDGLSEGQDILRGKQYKIIEKAHELTQHAANILDVFASEQGEPQKELLNVRRLVEHVLLEFFPYAESRGVTIRQKLDDVEPAVLNKDLALQSINNVIHNAIKYSHPGGVVEVSLYHEGDERADDNGTICTRVKDTGKGIPKEDQDRIFELRRRGNDLIEPGSGLGLYCAREAARRQGGDVILVISDLNQGSVFKIVFPYSDP